MQHLNFLVHVNLINIRWAREQIVRNFFITPCVSSEQVFLMLCGLKIDISQNRLSEVRVPKVTGQVSMEKQIHSNLWGRTQYNDISYIHDSDPKMPKNHIYHNENLFRITELYKKTSILFVFRAIFTKLQLLGKNRIWLPQKAAKK